MSLRGLFRLENKRIKCICRTKYCMNIGLFQVAMIGRHNNHVRYYVAVRMWQINLCLVDP